MFNRVTRMSVLDPLPVKPEVIFISGKKLLQTEQKSGILPGKVDLG